VFKPKIPIRVNFDGYCDGRCWYILWPFGLLYRHLAYFTASFGIFYGNLVHFPRFGKLQQKHLAILDVRLAAGNFLWTFLRRKKKRRTFSVGDLL
jgi:hypothetical protein